MAARPQTAQAGLFHYAFARVVTPKEGSFDVCPAGCIAGVGSRRPDIFPYIGAAMVAIRKQFNKGLRVQSFFEAYTVAGKGLFEGSGVPLACLGVVLHIIRIKASCLRIEKIIRASLK